MNPSISLVRLEPPFSRGSGELSICCNAKPLGYRLQDVCEGIITGPKVADVRALEVSWPPDMEAVGVAEAQFATAATAAEHHETHGSIQVLFDSFSRPASAGMRSAPMGVRELVCRAEPYQVDIQVEAQEEQNRLVITGQLLDVSQPDLVGVEVQITLSNLRASVVQTATNQFGEFRGELENSGDLEVSFLPRSGKPIVILLRGALKQSSRAKQ